MNIKLIFVSISRRLAYGSTEHVDAFCLLAIVLIVTKNQVSVIFHLHWSTIFHINVNDFISIIK